MSLQKQLCEQAEKAIKNDRKLLVDAQDLSDKQLRMRIKKILLESMAPSKKKSKKKKKKRKPPPPPPESSDSESSDSESDSE